MYGKQTNATINNVSLGNNDEKDHLDKNKTFFLLFSGK